MELERWLGAALTIIVAFFVLLGGLALVMLGITGGGQRPLAVRVLLIGTGSALASLVILLARIVQRKRRDKG